MRHQRCRLRTQLRIPSKLSSVLFIAWMHFGTPQRLQWFGWPFSKGRVQCVRALLAAQKLDSKMSVLYLQANLEGLRH